MLMQRPNCWKLIHWCEVVAAAAPAPTAGEGIQASVALLMLWSQLPSVTAVPAACPLTDMQSPDRLPFEALLEVGACSEL